MTDRQKFAGARPDAHSTREPQEHEAGCSRIGKPCECKFKAEAREPQAGWPIEVVRQRACDFGEGYQVGYDDGLEGNASDSETAWDRSRASAELAAAPDTPGDMT